MIQTMGFVTILWEVIELLFSVVLFALCYSMGSKASVNGSNYALCDASLESHRTILLCGLVCFVIQFGSNLTASAIGGESMFVLFNRIRLQNTRSHLQQ